MQVCRRQQFLLTPLREGRRCCRSPQRLTVYQFLLTPLREGRLQPNDNALALHEFLLTPLREGRPVCVATVTTPRLFLLTPLREGRPNAIMVSRPGVRFLLTPLREGRRLIVHHRNPQAAISTHAPAGGATRRREEVRDEPDHFYSRPCGRGDATSSSSARRALSFLLTPLREGRLFKDRYFPTGDGISTHAPAGGATLWMALQAHAMELLSTHAPAGGATEGVLSTIAQENLISTHAPAGGATQLCAGKIFRSDNFYSRPCGRGDYIKV